MRHTKATGFSLVELLVVITIISVLATTAVSSFNDSRAAARDTKRISDMQAIEGALLLFYQANGRYPNQSIDGVSNSGQIIGVGNPIDAALTPYISQIPIDPTHDAGTGAAPAAGSLYFYSYDPQHHVSLTNCSTVDGPIGTVFGFNRSETRGVVSKDTCQGTNVNLNNADFNRALFPAPN